MFTHHVSWACSSFTIEIQLSLAKFCDSFAVGKLPAKSVNDEKLEVLRKDEKEKIKKLFSKYISFCGKVCP